MLQVETLIAKHLRRTTPHHTWHYLLVLIALAIGSVPVWLPFTAWNHNLIGTMAILILSVYWLLQFRIVQSATSIAKRINITDRLVGPLSQHKLLLVKVRGIMKYYIHFIWLMSLALMGLSLMITVYYYFDVSWDDRGILRYVGVVSSGHRPWEEHIKFPFLEWPIHYILAVSMLFCFTLTNSFLSISFGLLTNRWQQASLLRLIVLGGSLCLFLSLYFLRETPAWTCHRSWMISTKCADMLFQLRVVDSLQAMLLSFLDGGTSLVTGIHLPMGRNPKWEGYQWRHLLVGIVTYLSQLFMSGYALWLIYRPKFVIEK